MCANRFGHTLHALFVFGIPCRLIRHTREYSIKNTYFMRKKVLLIVPLLSLACSAVRAQYIYTHIEQDGVELTKLGTAKFGVNSESTPQVEFTDGKAVMTLAGNTIATLPMSDNGEMVVEFKTTKEETALNTVTKTPKTSAPYVTIYSPFALKLASSEGGVYAPVYNSEKNTLTLSSAQKMTEGQIVAPETPLTVCGTTNDVVFTFATEAPTFTQTSSLSGSSLKINVPAEGTVYTYGVASTGESTGKYGLFKYTGSTLGAGLAYFYLNTTNDAKFIPLNFDDEVTAVNGVETVSDGAATAKFVENGRVVIRRGGKKFNLNGQEVY